MSSESVGANEFPDVVGVKAAQPQNPLLATFRPYIPAHVRIRELTRTPADRRHVAGNDFRRFVAVARFESRTNG